MTKPVAITDLFLPKGRVMDNEELRRHRMFITTCFITAIFAGMYIPMCVLINYQAAIPLLLFSSLAFLILPVLLRTGLNFVLLANIYIAVVMLVFVKLIPTQGGIRYAPVFPWILILPLMSLLLIGFRTSLFWLVTGILIIQYFGYQDKRGVLYPVQYDTSLDYLFRLMAFTGFILIFYFVVNVFNTGKTRAMQQVAEQKLIIEKEKKISDDLLLNILPEETADDLKKHGYVKPKLYPMVTVMFTDFVDFTKYSEKVSAEELVNDIHYYYSAFDQIVTGYGIEKIKTIGDSYMCASGLPVENLTHAEDMVMAAMAISKFMNEEKNKRIGEARPYFEIRTGIHSGPVVAGIAGLKKFAYDIWGDTVNQAARMQQCSQPGRINISATTYQLTRDKFSYSFRGKLAAKNKGEIEMYFLE